MYSCYAGVIYGMTSVPDAEELVIERVAGSDTEATFHVCVCVYVCTCFVCVRFVCVREREIFKAVT
jgi:hypothetical protein